MQKFLLFIIFLFSFIFLIIFNLHSESLFNILLPEPDLNNMFISYRHLSVSSTYYNAYNLDRPEGTDDYASVTKQKLSFIQPIGGLMASGVYRNEQYSALFLLGDTLRTAGFDYSVQSFDLSLAEKIGPLSVSETLMFSELPGGSVTLSIPGDSISISNIATITGEKLKAESLVIDTRSIIPFSVYFFKNQLNLSTGPLDLQASYSIPLTSLPSTPFQLKLEGYGFDGLCSLDIEPFTIAGFFGYSSHSISLFYNNSHYGEIEALSLFSWYGSVSYTFDENSCINAGITSLGIAAGPGSYVSTTPFYQSAGFYPIKYRIDELNASIFVPYAGIKTGIRIPSVLLMDIYIDYYYLFSSIIFRYSEREYIVYPFLFHYIQHNADSTLPIDSFLKMQGKLAWFISKDTILSLGIFLLIPFSLRDILSGMNGIPNQIPGTSSSAQQGTLTGGFALSAGLTFLQ
jgi:hypothetical protein